MTSQGPILETQQESPQRRTLRAIACLAILCAVAVVLSAAMHWREYDYPACCDAPQYVADALSISKNGIFHEPPSHGLRTFGYPLFLSLIVSNASDISWNTQPVPYVALIQTVLYIAACLGLFFVLRRANETAAWCSAIGLLCNPFVINYVPLSVSESLTVILFVTLAAIVCALTVSSSATRRSTMLLSTFGSFIAGYAIEVRPGNMAVAAAWVTFLIFHIYRTNHPRRALIAFSLLGFCVPLGAQTISNFMFFGKPTPLSAQDIAGLGIWGGIRYLKHATNLSGIEPIGIFYPNPFFDAPDIAAFRSWVYLRRPLQGAITMLTHVFGSVDYDQFFMFIYSPRPWYRVPVNAVNHAILFTAALAGGRLLISRINWRRQARFCPGDGLAIFLFMAAALTCAINAVVQVEVRYGLLVSCMAGPLAAYGMTQWVGLRWRGRIVTFGICLVYLALALKMSDWIFERGFLPGT